MERMKGPLWDIVPALLKQQKSDNKIPIGPIAERLLTCIEVLHMEKHLVIDVKPENFMLAYSDCNRKVSFAAKNASVAEGLARKIRLLDMGLVVPYRGAEGHRADDGIAELVGTPLYSSLNVHESHTPSRRDDIEALGYIISELIIRIVAAANGETSMYEGKKEIPTYLPWSHESSDEAIGESKKKQVNTLDSDFYTRMGDRATAQSMKEFFDRAQGIKYKETPDYPLFRNLISNLVVSSEVKKKRGPTGKPTSKKAKTTATGSSQRYPTRRSPRKCAGTHYESEEEESPAKHYKTTGEDIFEDAQEPAEKMDVEVLEISDDSYEDIRFHETHEGAEEMDWEYIPKENHQPKADRKKKARSGLEFVVQNGPHVGESFTMVDGETNMVVIGKNPKTSKTSFEALFRLQKDPEVDNSHVKLELRVSRQVCSVKVWDLNSSSGTVVGNKTIPSGGNHQAFVNDKFRVGQSTFRIAELSSSSDVIPKRAPSAKKSVEARSKTNPKTPLAQDSAAEISTNRSAKKPLGPADIVIAVVDGPHKGEQYALKNDEIDCINLGSASSVTKKGKSIILSSDEDIEKRHLRLQLVPSKKVMKVSITNLSDSGTKVNGNRVAPKKEHMCFIGDKITIGSTVLEVKRG